MMLALMIGLPIFLFAGYRLLRRFPGLWLAVSSRSWATTSGRITYAALMDCPTGETRRFVPDVHYEYTVGDQIYLGTQLRVEPVRGDESAIRHIVAERYPTGRFVRVFYNPADPEYALLEPGLPRRAVHDLLFVTLPLLLFGAVMTFAGVLTVLGSGVVW